MAKRNRQWPSLAKHSDWTPTTRASLSSSCRCPATKAEAPGRRSVLCLKRPISPGCARLGCRKNDRPCPFPRSDEILGRGATVIIVIPPGDWKRCQAPLETIAHADRSHTGGRSAGPNTPPTFVPAPAVEGNGFELSVPRCPADSVGGVFIRRRVGSSSRRKPLYSF